MKLKRIFLLTFVFGLTLAQFCFASDEKKLRVHLFYKIPDTILQVQNKQENLVEGQKEFEGMLQKAYSKRFRVEKVERLANDKVVEPADCYQMVGPLETPFLLAIALEGTGTTVQHYQNAFGAQVDGVAPTTYVHLMEVIPDRQDLRFYGIDYGHQSYTAGTFAYGQTVAPVDVDPRTNIKNAVKACVRDANEFNRHHINKYMNPVDYQMEEDRFQGNYKAWTIALAKKQGKK